MAAPAAIRMKGIPKWQGHAPKYGEHTASILYEINWSKALLTDSVSVASSKDYMPFTARCHKCLRPGQLVTR